MKRRLLSCLGLVGLLLIVAPRALAAVNEAELMGLWGYGTTFGPMLQGDLVIERQKDAWHATFGGLEAVVEIDGHGAGRRLPG